MANYSWIYWKWKKRNTTTIVIEEVQTTPIFSEREEVNESESEVVTVEETTPPENTDFNF